MYCGLFCATSPSLPGGGGGGVGEPHQEERLHHRGHLPRPLQVYAGLPRLLQSLGDLRPLLLPDPPPAHEEGAHAGGLPGQAGPSCQTHTGKRKYRKQPKGSGASTFEMWMLTVTLVPLLQYKLTVPKVGSISDLCTSLSNMSGVPAEKVCCHPPPPPTHPNALRLPHIGEMYIISATRSAIEKKK